KNMTTPWMKSVTLPPRWRQRAVWPEECTPGQWNGDDFDPRQLWEGSPPGKGAKKGNEMVGAQAKGACRAGGAGAAGSRAPLRGAGPVYSHAYWGNGPVSGHPGGGAHCRCGHLEADQIVRRLS